MDQYLEDVWSLNIIYGASLMLSLSDTVLVQYTFFKVKWGWEAGGRCERSLKGTENKDASISQIWFMCKDLMGKVCFLRCQKAQIHLRLPGFTLNVRDMYIWNLLPTKRL